MSDDLITGCSSYNLTLIENLNSALAAIKIPQRSTFNFIHKKTLELKCNKSFEFLFCNLILIFWQKAENKSVYKILQVEAGSKMPCVTALHDFEGADETQLSFKKGDDLFIIQDEVNGWFFGYIKGDPQNGGYIPVNFVNNPNQPVQKR